MYCNNKLNFFSINPFTENWQMPSHELSMAFYQFFFSRKTDKTYWFRWNTEKMEWPNFSSKIGLFTRTPCQRWNGCVSHNNVNKRNYEQCKLSRTCWFNIGGTPWVCVSNRKNGLCSPTNWAQCTDPRYTELPVLTLVVGYCWQW